MRRIWFYFILCSAAMASSEILYTKDQIIVVNNRTIDYVYNGKSFFNAEVYSVSQKEFFNDYLCKFWLDKIRPFTLHDFNQFAKSYVPQPKPWFVVDITKEQYEDWKQGGQVHTVEYLQAKKDVLVIKETVASEKAMIAVVAQIANNKYYMDIKASIWHVDPNCVDSVGCIEISPFDVLKYENRKQCEKCGGAK